MDPATPCGPTLACPARGHTGQGTLGLHSGQGKRCICRACRKPCTTTQGTALSRLRTSSEPVTRVVPLRAQGGPLQALVVAGGVEERTVAEWWQRAGLQGQAGPEHRGEHPRAFGQGQADASRVTTQGGLVWLAWAMLVRPRVWLAGAVSAQRDRRRRRCLRARVHAWALPGPLVCGTAGVCSSLRALRATLREPVRPGAPGRPRVRPWRHRCRAPVVKRSAPRRVVEVERRLVDGPPARVATRRRRSQGHGVLTTAASERRTAPGRARLASRTRRGRALARRPLSVPHGMSLLGTVAQCCPPPRRLGLPGLPAGASGLTRTPALAAGITEHCWTVQELRSSPVPPPRWMPPTHRGRPSRARQCLVARWCS